MRYNLLTVLFSALLLMACNQKDNVADNSRYITIKGTVGFPQNGKITLTPIVPDQEVVEDTIMLSSNYTFSKTIKITEPGYYRLNFYDRQVVNLILDQSDIEVNVDGNDQYGFVEIKGSPDHDLIRDIQQLATSLQNSPEVAELSHQMVQAQNSNNESAIEALMNKYQQMEAEVHTKIAELIKSNPTSLASVNMLQYNNVLDKERHFEVYQFVADALKENSSDGMHATKFIEFVNNLSVLAVGQLAPEIALPNPDGEVVKLSSLRGQYVMIDFWAKWCRPCRIENPNVVRLYNRFREKGFEIYGVSLDRTKEDWLQAIREDGLEWVHVSDLKFWQSEAAQRYNVDAIPFTVLLDPDGKIIAKNLRGKALEKKLEEIFESI